MPTAFLALYRGDSVSAAKLVALTAEAELVRDFATRLLAEPESENDPVTVEIERGRQRALRIVQSELGE